MRTIIDIFEEKVKKIPEEIALYYNELTLTYSQLSTYTNNLANYLINSYDIKKGTVIPILCKPSLERLIAIFTIFKMGCSYLPVSTESPKSRQEMLIELSGSKIVISNIEGDFSNINVINISEFDYKKEYSTIINNKTELAYLLFTSGSTGKPKGVCVTHDNLLYILENMQKYYPVSKGDKYLLGTPYTFDVSVTEIFGWILGEGSLIISNFETKNAIKEIHRIINKYKVSHMALSPSILGLLLKTTCKEQNTSMNQHLKYLMVAGEEFPAALGEKALNLLPDVVISNLYGPTETTVYVTHHVLTKNDIAGNNIPIGKELDGTQIYIINENNEIVRNGIKGEIFISGKCLTKGYLKNRKLTSEKFIEVNIPNRNDKIRGYKSGDLGLRDDDNNIIFFGRIDDQIQINGIRVEIGEIENVLLNNSDISQVVVIFHNNLLYAFYSTKNTSMNAEQLKEYSANKLPKYMHPKIYNKINNIPMNANGKADRKALINIIIEGKKQKEKVDKIEVLTEEEQEIKDILQFILKKTIISKKDNILELGIDSLNVLEIELALEKNLNIEIEAGFLYNYSNIEEIIKYKKSLKSVDIDTHTQDWDTYTMNINKQKIVESINKNQELSRSEDVIQQYEAFGHQKRFLHYGFDSYITVSISVSKSMVSLNREEMKIKLIEFLNHYDMFRSWLDYDVDKTLMFYTLNKLKNFEIPFISTSNLSKKNLKDKQDKLIDYIITCLRKHRLQYLPYQLFVLENESKYFINFVMDHCISDYASRHIIKRNLLKYLKTLNLDFSDTYYDYVRYIKNKNDKVDITEFLNQIEKGNIIKNRESKFAKLNKKLRILKIEMDKEKLINTDIICDIVYQVGLITSEYFDKDQLTQRIIINLRNFEDKKFQDVVGDCHACTYFVFNKDDSKEEHNKRFHNLMKDYHYKKAINFNYIANQDFSKPSLVEKKARQILFKDFPVDINFLGQLRQNELYDFFAGSMADTKTISNFGFEMVLAIAAVCNNQLYIGFMCDIDIKPNQLEKLNTIEVSISDLKYSVE